MLSTIQCADPALAADAILARRPATTTAPSALTAELAGLHRLVANLGALRTAAKIIATMPEDQIGPQAARLSACYTARYGWRPGEVARETIDAIGRRYGPGGRTGALPPLAGAVIARAIALPGSYPLLAPPSRLASGRCAQHATRRAGGSDGIYAVLMGLVEALGYRVRRANAAQVAVQHIAATRAGAWFFARTTHHVDRVLLRASRGRVTLPGIAAGIPVLSVTTTGARTGQRRSVPLLGVPAGEDIAVLGTRFGQSRNPGWYHNMRADPRVEVTYRGKTVRAVAREAGDEERQAIWDQGRMIYVGYQAYANRIKNRQIHIMILTSENRSSLISCWSAAVAR